MMATTVAGTVVVGLDRSGPSLGQERFLVGEWQQRIALRAAQMATRMLAQEKNNEREDEAETDGEGKRDDGHSLG